MRGHPWLWGRCPVVQPLRSRFCRAPVLTQPSDPPTHSTPQPPGSANNYLGLSNHPAVAAAAIEAIKTHGFGLSSVRFICGTQARPPCRAAAPRAPAAAVVPLNGVPSCFQSQTPQDLPCAPTAVTHSPRTGINLESPRPPQDLHKQLEARVSEFHGTEDTILFPTCFDANVRGHCSCFEGRRGLGRGLKQGSIDVVLRPCSQLRVCTID